MQPKIRVELRHSNTEDVEVLCTWMMIENIEVGEVIHGKSTERTENEDGTQHMKGAKVG